MKSLQQQSLVLLLSALYGSIFVLGKLTLTYSTPLFVTATRMICAGILLLMYQFFFHRQQFTINKQQILFLVSTGLFGVYLTNALEFYGLEFMSAGKACFLYSFSPIATALICRILYSERLSYAKWFGIILSILGFLPMLLAGEQPTEDKIKHFFFLSFAEIAMLLAAITSAVGWISMQYSVKTHKMTAVMANGVSMLFGGILALGHSWMTDSWDPIPIEPSHFGDFLLWIITLMIVSNLISYNLNAVLLRIFSATYMALAGLTQPLFAALFGWLFLNETVSPYFWISVVTVSIGLIIYYKDEKG